MIDFELTSHQKNWREKASNFALKSIAPQVSDLEQDLDRRQTLFAEMGRQGFFQLALVLEKGKADSISYLYALKEIASIDAGIAVAMAVTNMVGETIEQNGTSWQKMKYLEGLSHGEGPFAFALTEENAGSDVKQIMTAAAQNHSSPDEYLLSGEKKFITNADIATVTLVIAKTSSQSAGSQASAFLVDRGLSGFSITKIENKLGLLTANLVGIKFDRCRIPQAQRLGQEGEGFKIALKALDSGRLGVAAQALGIGTAAFEAARRFAMQRKQFGEPISKQQAIAFRLADMQVKLSAGELLLLKAAWRKDNGLSFTREAAEAKLFCSESANQIADEALQIHGGCGYTKDYLAEKYFRDARVTTIYEGTSEIQRLIIARHILSTLSAL